MDAPDGIRRSRHPRAARLGRLVHGLLPDRNPLRRGTDRLEAVCFAVLLAAVCLIAPFAARAASGWEHAVSQRELRTQQATWHHVRATLLDDAGVVGSYPALLAEAEVTFTLPHGHVVTEPAQVPQSAKAGTVIWIWASQSGQLVAPLRGGDIRLRDGLAAATAVIVVVIAGFLAGLTTRLSLNRRRMKAWGIDWMATEPRWNTRR